MSKNRRDLPPHLGRYGKSERDVDLVDGFPMGWGVAGNPLKQGQGEISPRGVQAPERLPVRQLSFRGKKIPPHRPQREGATLRLKHQKRCYGVVLPFESFVACAPTISP